MGRRPGFVPGRRTEVGPHCASPAMSHDPNADLIGYAYGDGIIVTGPSAWNPAYVAVETPDGPSVRVAAQVRRRKELG